MSRYMSFKFKEIKYLHQLCSINSPRKYNTSHFTNYPTKDRARKSVRVSVPVRRTAHV